MIIQIVASSDNPTIAMPATIAVAIVIVFSCSKRGVQFSLILTLPQPEYHSNIKTPARKLNENE
jgi:hypothetical protein